MWLISKRKQLVILCAAVIMPSFFSIYIAGIYFTMYRIAVPFMTLLCIAANSGTLSLKTELEKQYFVTFSFWILYGLVLMVLRNGPNKEGIKELTGLLLAVLFIYCVVNIIGCSRERFCYTVSALKLFVALCIVLGLFEIMTGWHLGSSIYSNPQVIAAQIARYGVTNTRFATGFQYNPNDYSSFLAFMAPLFLMRTGKKWQWVDRVALAAILFICTWNESTLCILALGVCLVYYMIKIGILATRKNVLAFTGIAGAAMVFLAYRVNSSWAADNTYSLLLELKNHLLNYQLKQGSSYVRIILYRDSIKAFFESGLLGIGPNSFTAYFLAHPSASSLVNPHNYWLEILTEYGIFVFLFFISLLLRLFRKTMTLYKKYNCAEGLALAVMYIGYLIVGLESSSFINYTFQWIPIALTLALLRTVLAQSNGEDTGR